MQMATSPPPARGGAVPVSPLITSQANLIAALELQCAAELRCGKSQANHIAMLQLILAEKNAALATKDAALVTKDAALKRKRRG